MTASKCANAGESASCAAAVAKPQPVSPLKHSKRKAGGSNQSRQRSPHLTIRVIISRPCAQSFAFFTAAWSLRQFTTPEGEGVGSLLISGLCGLATLALVAGLLYFSLALIKGVRDLTAPIARLPGYIERKYTGMGRTGGFWIVVQPGEDARVPFRPRAPV